MAYAPPNRYHTAGFYTLWGKGLMVHLEFKAPFKVYNIYYLECFFFFN